MLLKELDELYATKRLLQLFLSYSRVSDFDRNGPKALITKSFVENDGAKIGSIVDDLLTNKDNFDDIYFIYDGNKPTATTGRLCDIILKNYIKVPTKEVVLQICKDNDFWKRSSDEVLLKNFDTDEFWSYLRAQFLSKSKTLVTTDELLLSKELVAILKSHEFSKNIFDNNYRHINQYKFELELSEFKFRGVIDKILIDDEFKTVRFIDLKTGANPASEFMVSFMKWRYYLQEAVYVKAFKGLCDELGLEGYSLLPFQFLYISRFEKIPLLYTVSKKWHKAALHGFTTRSGYKYRGLNELLEQIKWHLTNSIFDMPRQTYESNGELILDDDFITVNE